MSQLEDEMMGQLELLANAHGIPLPERECVFGRWLIPPRKWRFDFMWKFPEAQSTYGNAGRMVTRAVALEVDGGTRSQGRHVRPGGYEKDCEKLNEAALLGYTVLRVTAAMVRDGRALGYVMRAFGLGEA